MSSNPSKRTSTESGKVNDDSDDDVNDDFCVVDVFSKLPSSSARTMTFSPKKKGRTKRTTRRRMEKNDENAADDGKFFARLLNGRFFDVEKASSSASFVLIVKRG